MARPLVTVQTLDDENTRVVPLPAVFEAPIRVDIVQTVHRDMNKNHRQPYAVNRDAGMQHAAESWGTGRAVSRIPRVSGSGTHRAGQAAFGNMCRKGRMFSPTKTWRKWHRRINRGQKRFATVSAIAASGVPALVMARGHRVENVREIPLVVADDAVHSISKTKDAVELLELLEAGDDLQKVKDSRKVRAGKGKRRNRRYVQRKGPLIICAKNTAAVWKAFRNIPGVEVCNVRKLNLLTLAPGGHVGRFIIWTEGAMNALDSIFGTFTKESVQKKGFSLPRPKMSNTDLGRIVNSDEVQTKLRPKVFQARFHPRKKNPLKNWGFRVKLNPYAMTQKRRVLLAQERRGGKRKKIRSTKRTRRASQKFLDYLLAPQAPLLELSQE